MQYRITLQANVELRQEFSGTTLVLLDTGAASTIDMKVEVSGYAVEELRGVKRGLKLRAPGFSGAKFLSTIATTIEVVVSAADISVNYQDGSTVNANIIGTVPVQNQQGDNVGNPIFVSGTVLGDTPAASWNNGAAVAASDVSAALMAADATRLEARIYNQGPDAVAIGKAGLTWATRTVVLAMGDTWIEQRGAGFAWVCITDTGDAATLTVQEMKS